MKRHPEVNELTLLQLARKHQFVCVRCDTRCKSGELAVESSTNALVCRACYDAACREGGSLRDALQRHASPLATFFREAGVPITLKNGWVVVRGKRAFKTRGLKSVYGKGDWDHLIDRVVFAACPDLLLGAMRRNGAALGENVQAYFHRSAHAFELRRGDESLGTIRPTRAEIHGERSVTGNFLRDGDHWEKVGRAVQQRDGRPAREAAEARDVSAARVSGPEAWRYLSDPPDGLPPELLDACLDASGCIRLRRSIAYSHPIILAVGDSSIRFSPILSSRSGLLVPFEFCRTGAVVRGAIMLGGASDPLTLRVALPMVDELVPLAWSTALLGFAAATCFSIDEAATRTPRAEKRRGTVAARTRATSWAGRHGRTMPRRRAWPSDLEPTGHWIAGGPSFVPGHRRRLAGGRSASAEAHERATLVGIALGPDETWVQPHTRGLAPNEEITFRWHAPKALAAL